MAIVVGIVVGSGIFFMPSLVAANAPSGAVVLGLWLVGGGIALVGALCYAELTTTYPDAGGDYYFLRRAYGPEVAFLFAWGRMTVVQTGALAAAAFIAGTYIAGAVPLGTPALYAVLLVVGLTTLNAFGLALGKWTQNYLAVAITVGLLTVVGAGLYLAVSGGAPAPVTDADGGAAGAEGLGSIGLAMVFILYTYGGWNEAAYLSAEIRAPQRNIALALIFGVAMVTAIYMIVNAAFLAGLGRERMASSEAVAADLLELVAGRPGALFVSALVVVAVLSTVNATIITGARSNYALGRDYPQLFGFMGRWQAKSSVPLPALLVQAAISVLLIVVAPILFEAGGVEAMVAYTAPVFWFFFFLVGFAVLILRTWDPGAERPFQVPFYPLTPLLFSVVCLYMLFSAIAYAGVGSLLGVAVLMVGVPLLALMRSR
jgi:APA family basic amino acid/polyamine antiporter